MKQQMADAGNVDDATFQAAVAAGWTEAQVAESSVHVVLDVLTNFFDHTVGTELDLPAAPQL